MAAVIALRAKDDRGVEIIVELEARTELNPVEVIEDDIRRYYLSAEDAGLDAFDPMLDTIDADWSDHVETFPRRTTRSIGSS
jgi:hypothetical protein